jgi:hypothetical protein
LLEVRLKVAIVVPPKLPVAITVPLSTSSTDVIPVVEAPGSLRIKLFKVTTLVPGFDNTTCWIVTLEAPGTWVELKGGFKPCEALTITSVGVPVNVIVEVAVAVTVLVAVFVKLFVGVEVAVLVAGLAKVLVGVDVVV